MPILSYILRSVRPEQWTKNLFVFAGIVFSLRFFHFDLLVMVIQAFVIFCLVASAIYLINDLIDAPFDRLHPRKKKRPIASGDLGPLPVLLSAVGLILVSMLWSWRLDHYFSLVVVSYLGLMLAYTFWLRNVVLLDVFAIALGFVLRAVAGVVVIGADMSPWLLICTLLLALFIALGKRRHELLTLDNAAPHRPVLEEYNPQLLDQLISAAAGSTVVTYCLYTLWPETVANLGTRNLIYSIPFALYGVYRYLYLIYKKEQGGQPEIILLTDLPLIVSIFLWAASLLLIVYHS